MKKRLLSLLMVLVLMLGMLPTTVLAADFPDPLILSITADVDGEITVEKSDTSYGTNGAYKNAYVYPCTVTVPAGTTKVYVTLKEVDLTNWDWGTEEYDGENDIGHNKLSVYKYDPNGFTLSEYSTKLDAELDYGPYHIVVAIPVAPFLAADNSAVALKYNDDYPYNPISFKFAEDETPAVGPFVSVKADGEEISATDIESKGDFALDGEGSTYYSGTYYETPWYHITVPAGTKLVEFVYESVKDIFYFMSGDAPAFAAYRAGIDADAVDIMSSATVKNKTLYNSGSIDSSGNYHIEVKVADYLFTDNEGYGFALEKNDYSPINMVTFEYAPCTAHNFANGVCTVCGEADPDYVAPAPGVSIPEGAPFTAIEGAISISDADTVDYSGYSGIPVYHVTVPEGTESVAVSYPAEADVFFSADYGNAVYGYYCTTDGSSGGMVTLSGEEGESGAIVVNVPLSLTTTDWNTYEETTLNFLVSEGYAVGPEDNGYAPINFFSFAYEAGPCEHSYSEKVTTAATCGAKGVKTLTCSKCGDSKTEDIPATGEHSYSEKITTAATCGKAGVKTFTCSGCGDSYTEAIPATGEHNETAVVTAPTCTKGGYTTYTCSGCGSTRASDITMPTGEHNYVDGFCDSCGAADPNGAPELTDGVYQIGTSAELLWFAGAVNSGDTAIKGTLTADINLTGESWPGIGTSSKPFAGSFDGAGKTVDLGNASVGLFGQVKGSASKRAEIKNVTVEGTVTATVSVGGIAGPAQYANFTACINRANVTASGNKEAAGITTGMGYNAMNDNGLTITSCGNEGNITSGSYSGGMLSASRGGAVIINCYNTGNIKGSSAAGGMVGYFQGYKGTCSITGCYNTGTMTASNKGGLVGSMYNNCSVSNSYNLGENYYAIAGHAYNGTNTVTNCYYLATASTEAAPAGKNITATALSGKEMSTADFAAQLSDANFQQSCPAPVFTWQSAAEHKLVDGACTECGYGAVATYDVTLPSSEMYTVTGATTVTEGGSYSFTVTIAEDYQAGNGFAVRVNGEAVTESDGTYTVSDVKGPLVITVEGVEKIPDSYAIHLPDFMGNGYRVTAANGSSNPAPRGGSYSFTVTFPYGFQAGEKFAVRVNGEKMTAENGVYTIRNIQAEQTITVEDVATIPYADTASVTFTFTSETMDLYKAPGNGRIMLLEPLEVPYFDLGLYGLQRYYYHPNSYDYTPYRAGNREMAYGVITAMHAFIYATEIYYFGYDAEDAGKGLSHQYDTNKDGKSDFDEAISWTGGAGSSFMDIWGRGTNLNYYENYTYPLSSLEGIGSTSDQIPVYDGYKIDLHFIENSNASGSDYGFFVVNDNNGDFDGISRDQVDYATVKQGDELVLTMYTAGADSNWNTDHWTTANRKVYWTEASNLSASVKNWNRTSFGGLSTEALITGADGTITLDTAKIAPGTYYIAAEGGFREGGQVDNGGFTSRGTQAGPAILRLTVEACEHNGETETAYQHVEGSLTHTATTTCTICGNEISSTTEDCVDEDSDNLCDKCDGSMGAAAPSIVYGDVDGNGSVNANDASLVYRYVNNKLSASQLANLQLAAMDVSGDGNVNVSDAAMIYRFANNKLSVFPAEQ